MSNYFDALIAVLKIEGGYSNDPADRGGETYRGISRKNWAAWPGWKIIDTNKKKPNFPGNLSDTPISTLVADFYKKNFWDALNLDQVKNQSLAIELFDTAVNMSPNVSGKFLQRALNMLNRNQQTYKDIVVDGIVGPGTIALVNSHKDPEALYNLLNTLQGARYIEIVEKDRTQERFMYGWLARTYKN